MDPFVKLEYRGKTYKTKADKNGGQTPVWNQTFEISIESTQESIKITCMDDDFIYNDYIGEINLTAEKLCTDALTR